MLAVMWESKSFDDNSRFGCWMKEHPKDVLRLNFEHKTNLSSKKSLCGGGLDVCFW